MACFPLSQDLGGVSREEVGRPHKTTLLTGWTWWGMVSQAPRIKTSPAIRHMLRAISLYLCLPKTQSGRLCFGVTLLGEVDQREVCTSVFVGHVVA